MNSCAMLRLVASNTAHPRDRPTPITIHAAPLLTFNRLVFMFPFMWNSRPAVELSTRAACLSLSGNCAYQPRHFVS